MFYQQIILRCTVVDCSPPDSNTPFEYPQITVANREWKHNYAIQTNRMWLFDIPFSVMAVTLQTPKCHHNRGAAWGFIADMNTYACYDFRYNILLFWVWSWDSKRHDNHIFELQKMSDTIILLTPFHTIIRIIYPNVIRTEWINYR